MILLMLAAPPAFAKEFVPLAFGSAPPCSKHDGTREFHSTVVQDGDASALIVGIARRDASGCHQSAAIRIDKNGEKNFRLPADGDDFEIVDFSPDGATLFIAEDGSDGVQMAAMPIGTGEMRWQNISDLLGWQDCDATIEPQGYSADGKLMVRVRPSVLSPAKRPNCVQETHLYAFNDHWKATPLNADSASIARYGKKSQPPSQSCKSDPDVSGECFSVHGRISAYNGNPTFRMWRIGTKRMLGISQLQYPGSETVVLPPPLAGKVSFDETAWGDYLVCPLTEDTPGWMQMVCVESASHVSFKPR